MRIALTGGSSGIGAAVVETAKARGWSVTAFDLHEPTGPIDRWIKTDLADPASIDAAVDAAQGPFEALINNAGLPPREGMAATILAVNFLGLRRFLGAMLGKLAPGAAIVNTASRAGGQWRENLAEAKALAALESPQDAAAFVAERGIDPTRAYNLSKEAVIALTIAEAGPMTARGLRMNCVSPGAVSTAILGDFHAAFGERVARNVARAGRPATPQEVAEVILFLAGPESAWIKGADIPIDGGMGAMALSDALDCAGLRLQA